MLVRNLTDRGGPGKLRPHWEQQIHVVTQKREDMPVYEVRPENRDGRSRVLHRNLLLPCSYLPIEIQIKRRKSKQRGPRKVTKRPPSTRRTPCNTDEDTPNLTPRQLEDLCESTSAYLKDSDATAPVPAEQDVDPLHADA